MLIDKLKNWEYYYKKLPLYMRNSYGIQDHFKIVFDFMIAMDANEEEVCNLFDLLQKDYLNNVVSKYDDVNAYDFKFLDIIGSLYGVNRSLNVTYEDENTSKTVFKSLYLTNKELYLLIKARIVQNNYDGTYLQARDYYENIDLPLYMFTGTNPAECYLYLGTNDNTLTDNIKDLFMANLLTLKSVGIIYHRYQVDISKMGIWADKTEEPNQNNQWDVSVWL